MKPETNAVCSIFLAIVGVAVLGASLFAKFTGALGGPSVTRVIKCPMSVSALLLLWTNRWSIF